METRIIRAAGVNTSEEVRCHCGQLMARLVDEGIELKCKRCRRLMVIPFSKIQGWVLCQKHRN